MSKREIFRRLKALASEACEAAQALSSPERRKLGAVNWAHLGPDQILYCEDEDGSVTWSVTICEASPDSGITEAVAAFIRTEMPGLPLEVRAEW